MDLSNANIQKRGYIAVPLRMSMSYIISSGNQSAPSVSISVNSTS